MHSIQNRIDMPLKKVIKIPEKDNALEYKKI